MAVRGRVNKSTPKAKPKGPVGSKPSAKAKASGKAKVLSTGLGIAKGLIGIKTKAKGGARIGFGGKKTAKMLLKKAYERRAKRQIRLGQLGQARRTLRKKTTVI